MAVSHHFRSDVIRSTTLNRTGKKTADKVALHGQEHDHWHNHRNHGRCVQQVQLMLKRPQLLLQTDREHEILCVTGPDIERNQQVIPNPEELEYAKGRQSRHRQR